MEITLMPRTKGTGHKLRDTSMMECITQTLETNTVHSGKVFVKSLEGRKQKFTQVKRKAVEGMREKKEFWCWCKIVGLKKKMWFSPFYIGMAYRNHPHNACLPFLPTVLRFCVLIYKCMCLHTYACTCVCICVRGLRATPCIFLCYLPPSVLRLLSHWPGAYLVH